MYGALLNGPISRLSNQLVVIIDEQFEKVRYSILAHSHGEFRVLLLSAQDLQFATFSCKMQIDRSLIAFTFLFDNAR